MNILTPTGDKNINDVNIGDEVCYFDEITGLPSTNILLSKDRLTSLEDAEWKWYLINGTYKVFCNQSIWRNNNKVTHVYLLEVGDIIYSDTDGDIEITSFEETTPDEFWYRLEVSGDHSYIADGITFHNASRYFIPLGNGNWNSTTNWSATSGGASGASFPVAGDAVNMDSNSGTANITINVSSACTTLVQIATYTGTVTLNAQLSVSSTFTLIAGTTWINNSTLALGGTTSTITSGGLSIGNMTCSGSKTLGDNWDVGSFSAANNIVLTSNTLTINGDFTHSGNISGTTNIIGAGTTCIWNDSSGNHIVQNNLTFNSDCALTLGSSIGFQTGILTINSTSFNAAGNTARFPSTGTLTFTDNIIWNNVNFFGTASVTNPTMKVGGILKVGSINATLETVRTKSSGYMF